MRKCFFAILFVLFSVAVNSQELTANSQQPVSYLKSYWHSGLTVLGQPLHYDWKDWTIFGGVATATTFAFIYDDDIFNFVDKTFTNSQSNTISQYTDIYGEELFIVPSIALTYTIGAIDKNPRLKNMSLAALQSFIFAEVTSAGIKVLTCRMRPLEVDESMSQCQSQSHRWLGPFASFESTSFVSGHATRAFALASTVAGFYPDKRWLGILSYSLATATSLGRVVSKEHWTSDVIVGAALGYFIGRVFAYFSSSTSGGKRMNSIVFVPAFSNFLTSGR